MSALGGDDDERSRASRHLEAVHLVRNALVEVKLNQPKVICPEW